MTQSTIIPKERLSAEALEGVIDEFVTREGTEYGHADHTLEQKRLQVHRAIDAGDVLILFEAEGETCNLVHRSELPARTRPKGRRAARMPVTEASSRLDSLILTYMVAQDLGALEQLTSAGLSAENIRDRAVELDLTNELVKRLRLSGKPPGMRECLKCSGSFVSAGSHNRLCSRCQ